MQDDGGAAGWREPEESELLEALLLVNTRNMTDLPIDSLQRRTSSAGQQRILAGRRRLRLVASALRQAVRVDRRPAAASAAGASAAAVPVPRRKIKRFKVRSRLSMRDR
jgi:hypothetical protein